MPAIGRMDTLLGQGHALPIENPPCRTPRICSLFPFLTNLSFCCQVTVVLKGLH
jgi:hypothetical protein